MSNNTLSPETQQANFTLCFLAWLDKNFCQTTSDCGDLCYFHVSERQKDCEEITYFTPAQCLEEFRSQQVAPLPEMSLLSSAYTTILQYADKAERLRKALELVFELLSADIPKDEIKTFIAEAVAQNSNP